MEPFMSQCGAGKAFCINKDMKGTVAASTEMANQVSYVTNNISCCS